MLRNSALLRGALGVLVGLPLSLIAGAAVSYLPESPLEGLSAGIVVSSALFVVVLVLLSWTRGPRPFKRWLFELHSFVGLAAGIFFIVLFLSGVLLLFRAEIEAWSSDWQKVRPGAQFVSIDAWLDAVSKKADLESANRVDIGWPKSSTSPAEIRVSGPEGSSTFYIDPYRANVLEGELSTWMGWVRELHTSLHIEHVGGFLAGLTALGAVWLVISGLLMRRGLFRDWRILRVDKGARVFASDLHMRVALWLFPFLLLMAYSGMVLAFSAMLSAAPVRILFDGSQSRMYAALGYPQKVTKSERALMPPLEPFARRVRDEMPEVLIRSIQVIGFGDRNAIVSVYASRPGDLAPKGTSLIMNFRAVTNQVIYARRYDDMGIFGRFSAAMMALHVGDFDEPAIRLFYAGASAALMLLPILGIVIWLLRRRDLHTTSPDSPPELTT